MIGMLPYCLITITNCFNTYIYIPLFKKVDFIHTVHILFIIYRFNLASYNTLLVNFSSQLQTAYESNRDIHKKKRLRIAVLDIVV